MKNCLIIVYFWLLRVVLSKDIDLSSSIDDTCSLRLGWASYENGGRTVFTGKSFVASEFINFCPALLLRNDSPTVVSRVTTVQNYLFASGDSNYSFLVFGFAALTNYGREPSKSHIDHVWNSSYLPTATPPDFSNSVYFFDGFRASQFIEPGEELQFGWGAVTHPSPSPHFSSDDSPSVCLSSVEVRPSSLPDAGYGVFSHAAFKKEELVVISPVVFLPFEDEETRQELLTEMLLNYCYYEKGSSLLVLPLNTPAIMNHYRVMSNINETDLSVFAKREPNVKIQWFDWYSHFNCSDSNRCSFPPVNPPRRVSDILDLSFEDLLYEQRQYKQALIDIGYYALRDIAEGEELVIDYGNDWEEYYRRHDAKETKDFRHSIELPAGFLPNQWKLDSVQQEDGDDDFQCDGLFIAPSTIPNAGRGIFAGKRYRRGADIQKVTSTYINTTVCNRHQLVNYVFGTNHPNYSMVQFGIGSLFNHAINNNVYHFWTDEEIDAGTAVQQTTYLAVDYEIIYRAEHKLNKNQELLSHYGKEWLSTHGFPEEMHENEQKQKPESIPDVNVTNLEHISMNDWKNKRICLSTVEVRPSTLPNAGYGVFTKRSYKKDKLITISPVLLLNYNDTETREQLDNEMLLNYCYYDQGSSVLLLPLNIPVLINHYRPLSINDSEIPVTVSGEAGIGSGTLLSDFPTTNAGNVRVEWFDWNAFSTSEADSDNSNTAASPPSVTSILSIPLSELVSAPYGKLDIAFYAVRDIAEDEELFLDYGKEWEELYFSYLSSVAGSEGNRGSKPFRQWIQSPHSLQFPDNWYVTGKP
jgi:hypothetical protein